MANEISVHATLDGKMRFQAETGSGFTLSMDAAPESGGENSAPRPTEVMLASLAGCTGITLVSILRKQRQEITSYELHLRSERTSAPGTYTTITVEHVLSGPTLTLARVERALELAEQHCTVGILLGKALEIKHTVRLVEHA
ncbi:putative redox protein [Thermosporothrix hazakensis]|uniref:Peroxiredoxin n=2 Tax=Thermosporothrix TaxID=768650 RepID=A0A455SL36_9CHLR|nr:OsmC family protein [Thermosporothrix hazakensis]PZW29498.1 putative redox protein [Thermosporothrix hazakensis]BBH85784.1 hypothetical protein KTC_05350 [Thermosporothrix sp. COM3]GCE45787.1 hypothetical protein KTH_06560 [Thermosporothrix hazakensis]